MLHNMRFFAKGHRSTAYIGLYLGGKAIAKVAKPGFEYAIRKEAEWLRILNRRGIGPKLLGAGDDYIIVSFVEGVSIADFLEQAARRECLRVLSDILLQCRKLDRLFINKEEMCNPYKHIIISGNKAVMIDFERCKSSGQPKNVTQFCQFLLSAKVSGILLKKGIRLERKKVIAAAKAYKVDYSDKNFKAVRKSLLGN